MSAHVTSVLSVDGQGSGGVLPLRVVLELFVSPAMQSVASLAEEYTRDGGGFRLDGVSLDKVCYCHHIY